MGAYYNEIDPYAAQWLRNLIAAGHIAPGDVDERSIEDVVASDLRGYTQCHFFAGIGVWSHALRLAGWSDDQPVWTGSCPCQPFSAAGKGDGFADERHLWPAFHWLIEQCCPPVVFGEQVASKDGLEWLDLVQTDLEGSGYASAAFDLCAAGVGAPHIRQRLYWVADAQGKRCESFAHIHAAGVQRTSIQQAGSFNGLGDLCTTSGCVADADHTRLEGHRQSRTVNVSQRRADAKRYGGADSVVGGPSPTNGYWRDADWLFCRDGKWRPVEPGTFPLAHGAAARVGRLRAYGNAIVPQVAQAIVEAYLES